MGLSSNAGTAIALTTCARPLAARSVKLAPLGCFQHWSLSDKFSGRFQNPSSSSPLSYGGVDYGESRKYCNGKENVLRFEGEAKVCEGAVHPRRGDRHRSQRRY